MSAGEQAVYHALWNLAASMNGVNQAYRDIRVGYVRLAKECGMAVSHCRTCLEILARKLALDVVTAAGPGACGYRIYGYKALYRRLTTAEYRFYIKAGPGVNWFNRNPLSRLTQACRTQAPLFY